MNLEQKVRIEVDIWNISVNVSIKDIKKSVSYESKIKSFYYGMGISVTEKGVAIYSQNRKPPSLIKSYTSFDFSNAVEEFKKDLVIRHYLTHGTVKETAKILSVGNNEENGRVILCQILNRRGLTFNEVKLNPDKFMYVMNIQEFNISDEKVVNEIYEETRSYSKIIMPILFQRLLLKNAREMAIKFAAIAKEIVKEDFPKDIISLDEYKNMTLREASECFKSKYFKQQFIDCDMNAQLAAEKAGISYESYKEHMSRRKINMTELKKTNISNPEENC